MVQIGSHMVKIWCEYISDFEGCKSEAKDYLSVNSMRDCSFVKVLKNCINGELS